MLEHKIVELRPVTILSHFLETVREHAQRPALLYKKGHYLEELSYKRLLNLAACFSYALQKLDVGRGDRVALLSENRPEWVVADLALQSLGAILVPIHMVLSADQMRTVISEVEPKLIIASDERSVAKVLDTRWSERAPWPALVYLEESAEEVLPKGVTAYSFIEALRLVPHGSDILDSGFKDRAARMRADAVVTILYTSGSTGAFKGVELTAGNLTTNTEDVLTADEVRPDDRFLSVLPLSHIFERTVGYYVPLFSGASIAYVDDLARIAERMREMQPTIIVGVPRLFEKAAEVIGRNAMKSRLKRFVFGRALAYGKREEKRGTRLHALYDRLVYSKVRNSLGGKMRFFISGGAALKPETAEFFEAMGVYTLEGYGLTETSPIITCNRRDGRRYGTVGVPMPRSEVKIAEDGEILARGPGVMKGYYLNEAMTKDVFNDGWLKTGDLGELSADGYLKITGRKKETIVLSNGRKVAPEPVEETLRSSPLIEQALVFGNDRKYLVAVVVPDRDELERRLGGRAADASRDRVAGLVKKESDRISSNLAEHQRAKKLVLADEPFTTENEMLTPTLKPRRHKVYEKYRSEIDELYGKGGAG